MSISGSTQRPAIQQRKQRGDFLLRMFGIAHNPSPTRTLT